MNQDPLYNAPTETARDLFSLFVKLSNGKQVEDVLGAAINLIANCLRQSYGLRSEVEPRMQELFSRAMTALLEHYDPVTGRRRSVIPFDQSIRPHLILSEDAFSGIGDKKH